MKNDVNSSTFNLNLLSFIGIIINYDDSYFLASNASFIIKVLLNLYLKNLRLNICIAIAHMK
jgi:hypothetical protein